MVKKRKKPVEVVAEPSRCPKCRSSKRTKYNRVRTQSYAGIWKGFVYRKIVWRACTCRDCGQSRVDKSFES